MLNKNFNLVFLRRNVLLLSAASLSSCTIFFIPRNPPELSLDHVCGTTVNKRDSYEWNHNGTEYYFDTFSCKETFKMNPEKFTANKSDAK